MIISRKVIAQWLDITNIKDQEIVLALNSLGFEVEKVKNLMFSNTNLIVGKITNVIKHPKSNKLNICEVDNGSELLTIICGASNVITGIKVVVAQVGSTLANGLIIDKRTIMNVVSSGMLCSLSELGMEDNVQNQEELSGIIHLSEQALIGNINPLQYLNLDDTVFFIDLTVNRSDCLGIYSIASELAAYFKISLKKMNITTLDSLYKKQIVPTNQKIQALATLKISFNQTITKITPMWVKRILQLANIKPKTLAEDIANFVMLELGQPLLIFNGDVLKEPHFSISPKSYPEGALNIKTGDILLHDKLLVISVLGINYNSAYEVKENTKNIFLFSINPNLETMNNQVKNHDVISNILLERLTKPLVPDYYIIALQRYLFILESLKIEYDVLAFNNDIPYENENKLITINFNFINSLLGTDFAINHIVNCLVKVGCKIEYDKTNNHLLQVTVPSHRNDLHNSNDLCEEVARVIGYDNLPITRPHFTPFLKLPTLLETLLEKWKNYLLSNGFNQVKTYSLTNNEDLTAFNFFNYKNPIKLLAPLTSTREVMRFSLTNSLVKICQYNYARKVKQLKIFTNEVIYNDDSENPNHHHLALAMMGDFWPKNSNNKNNNVYYIMKGFLEGFLKMFLPTLSNIITYKVRQDELLHPYLSADIFYEKNHIATLGALHPQIEKEMTVEKIFVVEINCDKLIDVINTKQTTPTTFKAWSKFNALTRDISLLIDKNYQFSTIKTAILNGNIPFLEEVSLIDYYTDEKFDLQNQYSLTFQLKFNTDEKQLDEKSIIEAITMVQSILIEDLKAIIR